MQHDIRNSLSPIQLAGQSVLKIPKFPMWKRKRIFKKFTYPNFWDFAHMSYSMTFTWIKFSTIGSEGM
jgi:hypothetical protein